MARSDDLLLRLAGCGLAVDVVPSALVAGRTHESDLVQGGVCGAVAAAGEPVCGMDRLLVTASKLLLTRGSWRPLVRESTSPPPSSSGTPQAPSPGRPDSTQAGVL